MTTIELLQRGEIPADPNQALLDAADYFVKLMITSKLEPEETRGWDRHWFNPNQTYLPMPSNAAVFLVSRYSDSGLVRATYHVPADDITVEAVAGRTEEGNANMIKEDGLEFDVLSTLSHYIWQPELIGVQAFKVVTARPRPWSVWEPKAADGREMKKSDKRHPGIAWLNPPDAAWRQ